MKDTHDSSYKLFDAKNHAVIVLFVYISRDFFKHVTSFS